MFAITPSNSFYHKIETYKKSLQQNRPKNMTDAQFNEQVERYIVGLQRDEFKRSNKEYGRNFAKSLSMEKNGTAKAIEEKQFAQALEQKKQWLKASAEPRVPNGLPVNKNRLDAVMYRQESSKLKGEINQVSHMRNLEIRAESGNASVLQKAKIKRKAEKQLHDLIDEIIKRTPDHQVYESRVNSGKIQRRIRNSNTYVNNAKNTVKESTKNMSWKGKLGIVAAAIASIGILYCAIADKNKTKSHKINSAA